jgi:hypothetical protein
MSRREGRVKPEFELWYPGLRAGVWYPADELTSAVLKQLRGGEPQWAPEDRVPSDTHFQFRGGTAQPQRSQRTRHADPPSGQSA